MHGHARACTGVHGDRHNKIETNTVFTNTVQTLYTNTVQTLYRPGQAKHCTNKSRGENNFPGRTILIILIRVILI